MSLFRGRPVAFLWRLVLFSAAWLILLILNISHWLGFIVDELLFRGYRKVEVKKPIFIVGVPRSGTTWLQRVMAQDASLTSLTLWECVLAPSISERYFWRGVAWLVKPVAKFMALPVRHLFKTINSIHKIGLTEAEEDFLLLLPVQACFLLVLLCPGAKHYWRLAKFDEEVPALQKKIIMRYYRACLQKHLYFHGEQKRLLSKNPSFTPFIQALTETFVDARFVACIRAPEKTVASQLSSLMPTIRMLGAKAMSVEFRNNMLNLLHYYYQYIAKLKSPSNLLILEMSEISQRLGESVSKIYGHCDLEVSSNFQKELLLLETQGKKYKSGHTYDLDAFSLSRQMINEKFSLVWPMN